MREPTVCDRCGAVFSHRTWRRPARVSHALLMRAEWRTCPACRQTAEGSGRGRVVVSGSFALAHEGDIAARIRNVASRAAHTQPERRIVSMERRQQQIEIVTTSQKLAHRIVHELKKAFRGRASYVWSDDGTLFATWHRDDPTA